MHKFEVLYNFLCEGFYRKKMKKTYDLLPVLATCCVTFHQFRGSYPRREGDMQRHNYFDFFCTKIIVHVKTSVKFFFRIFTQSFIAKKGAYFCNFLHPAIKLIPVWVVV